jgi:hypothetical protein
LQSSDQRPISPHSLAVSATVAGAAEPVINAKKDSAGISWTTQRFN